MKIWTAIFATFMFLMLFVAPMVQIITNDNVDIVLQEFEDSSDSEEGEDLKLKDLQEKLYCQNAMAQSPFGRLSIIQDELPPQEQILLSQQLGVETPPPKLS